MAASDSPPIAEWLERLGASAPAPSGVSAAALGCAMGMALLEKALGQPAPGQDQRARQEASVLNGLRKRVAALLADDEEAWADFEAAASLSAEDEPALLQKAARVAAYRTARRLVDFAIQGLTQLPHALDFGASGHVAEVEIGARFLLASVEGGIAAADELLKTLPEAFAVSERPALERQALQAREMWDRGLGALSWRRGKA